MGSRRLVWTSKDTPPYWEQLTPRIKIIRVNELFLALQTAKLLDRCRAGVRCLSAKQYRKEAQVLCLATQPLLKPVSTRRHGHTLPGVN